jgi:hypothetical protein
VSNKLSCSICWCVEPIHSGMFEERGRCRIETLWQVCAERQTWSCHLCVSWRSGQAPEFFFFEKSFFYDSRAGGALANHHLRQSLAFCNVPLLQQPEVYVSGAFSLFDETGKLKADAEGTKKFLASFGVAFHNWVSVLTHKH